MARKNTGGIAAGLGRVAADCLGGSYGVQGCGADFVVVVFDYYQITHR